MNELNAIEFSRRLVLRILGASGASLLVRPSAALAASVTPTATTTTCPVTPMIGNLPSLAALVQYLISSKRNRQVFNEHPDELLSQTICYNLSDDDRAALLSFEPDKVFIRVDTLIASAPPEVRQQFYAFIYNTLTFWKSWKKGEDNYPDNYQCAYEGAAKPQYAYPELRLYGPATNNGKENGKDRITFVGQGILNGFQVAFEHESNSALNIPASDVYAVRDTGSTFRCSQVTARATLQTGENYFIIVNNTSPTSIFADKLPVTGK